MFTEIEIFEKLPSILLLSIPEVEVARYMDQPLPGIGCWEKFLNYLFRVWTHNVFGQMNDVTWTIKTSNFTRWIKVTIGDEVLMIVLDVDDNTGLTFSVATSNEDIIPYVLMYGDHITGEVA